MRKTKKRILSFICILGLLLSGCGDIFPYLLSSRTLAAPVSVSRQVTASDGSTYEIRVTFDSESGIPENAELQVQEITPDQAAYADYVSRSVEAVGMDREHLTFARAFDISLVNPRNGREYQPDTEVSVSVRLLEEEEHLSDSKVNVIHFAPEPEVLTSAVSNGNVVFLANSFSVYVLLGDDAVPHRTYNFYVWSATDNRFAPYMFTTDTGIETASQTVINGQTPVVPQPPTYDDSLEFAGWYAHKTGTQEYEDEPFDFSTEITTNEVIDLYAVFKEYIYVYFHDLYSPELGDYPIAAVRRGEKINGKATVQVGDFAVSYSGRDKAFYAWSETPVEVNEEGDPIAQNEDGTIEITGEKHLYPIFRGVKWLTYWSGPAGSGATYYPAAAYFGGVGPHSPLPVPTRSGYRFMGWYAGTVDEVTGEVTYGANPISDEHGALIHNVSDGGMTVYDERLHLDTDATLCAKWEEEEATVSYKIIIWKQKTTADADTPAAYKYDFVESIIKVVPAGSDATIDAQYKEYATTKPAFAGYTCHCDANVSPADPQGYTVLNVYYDREGEYSQAAETHTLKFYDPKYVDPANPEVTGKVIASYAVAYQTNLLTGNAEGSFVPADPTRAHYTFTAWFADENLTTQVFFTQEALDAYTGYNKTVLYDQMPNNDLTLYAGWEAEWYLVRIDPNYGTFNGSGSTWFWKTIEQDVI